MELDLVLRGGIVIDGSGLVRRVADVGVRDGTIVAIGSIGRAPGARVIDVEGRVVAPGIVDIHTHYDPQLLFEPCATPSCYHGVTSVVAGNCGFSIAPTRDADRTFQAQFFSKVEGMNPEVLAAMPWDFETFDEYLANRGSKLGVNLACYVGHSSVRRWVMGEAASERTASKDEVLKMAELVGRAMAGGAAGFSSSYNPTHTDPLQRPIPSRFGDSIELFTLAQEVGLARVGTIAFLPAGSGSALTSSDDQEQLIHLSIETRRPVITQGLGGRSKVDAPRQDTLDRFFRTAQERGAAVYSLLRVAPFERPFTLADSQRMSNYEGVPAWRRFLGMPLAERLTAVREPRVRDEMRYAVENPNTDPAEGSMTVPPSWEQVIVRRVRQADNVRLENRSIADIAAELGVAPADAMLDLAAGESLQTQFLWLSDDDGWRESVERWQRHPNMIPGVSDGGAHLDRDDGSGWSTYFLRTWALDRGVLSLEEAVRRISSLPAMVCGLGSVGVIREGFRADLMVFDQDELGLLDKEVVCDFPGSAPRWQQRPSGVTYTIVNGEVLVDSGELTGALPGRVIRVAEAARGGAWAA